VIADRKAPLHLELEAYKLEELIGTRYDRLTALNTTDIPTTYTLFSKLGYTRGLWTT
jgi:hypothetical protein